MRHAKFDLIRSMSGPALGEEHRSKIGLHIKFGASGVVVGLQFGCVEEILNRGSFEEQFVDRFHGIFVHLGRGVSPTFRLTNIPDLPPDMVAQ